MSRPFKIWFLLLILILPIDILCCMALYQIYPVHVLINGIMLMVIAIILLSYIGTKPIYNNPYATYDQKKNADCLNSFNTIHPTSILQKKLSVWIWIRSNIVGWFHIANGQPSKNCSSEPKYTCTINNPSYHIVPPEDRK